MTIYIDLLFVFNCWIDFFLLLFVKLILRRNTKIHNLLLASLIGGITTFCLFSNMLYPALTIIKLLLAIPMVVISFGFRDMIYTVKNIFYLFMAGIILGGIASFIKINIRYRYFYVLIFIIVTPIVVYLFYKQNQTIKKQYNLYYSVKLIIRNYKELDLCGFLDSGNNLKDPITKKYIVLINKKKLKGINKIRSPMYVPVKTVNKNSLISCYKPDKLYINGKNYSNFLIGVIDKPILLDGVDCLLNNRLLEDL